ncbi:sporulation protein YunB [Thermicanus aegyptius]|uniref:sporulation protein YunB n=1 Tax=Thermicanus aegyptius TaxID=94009 RepID=UPI00048AE168|nr:sporulation protein YunB [Thermicanus aegyptius]
MTKMRLGKPRRKKGRIFFFILVLFLVLMLQTFWYVEKKIQPVIRDYAIIKVEEIAIDAINDAITKKIAEKDHINELFNSKTDQNNKITSISLDVKNASLIQAEATQNIRDRLEEASHQTFQLPVGVALNSEILATYGPKIPISFVPLGAVDVSILPVLQETGINNVLLTVNLNIKTKIKVVIPFSSEEVVVEQKVPIAQQFIVGEVPSYYFRGSERIPFQTIPLEGIPSTSP